MPNPNASSPVDPQVLTLFQEELARSGALPGLAPAGAALWPRFVGYYQGLARLPRRLRRALQRRWRRSLGGIALLCAVGQAPALASSIFVDGTSCTLVEAINAANSDAPAGGCSAGSSGLDFIVLPSDNQSLTAVNNNTYGPTGLPVITSELTIQGGTDPFDVGCGSVRSGITRDGSSPEFRILAVGATGNLTLRSTTVSGGMASSGAASFKRGAGIYNRGTARLSCSTVSGNSAEFVGGGIHNMGAMTLAYYDTVSGNTGGGIRNLGTLILTGSTISGNSTEFIGGGIDNSGTLTVTDSTISGNTGGGINNHDYFVDGTLVSGTLSLTNSTISGNLQESGIDNSGTLTVTNSTISGNTARGFGGGIFNSFATMTVTGSTVEGNTAQNYGGIFNFGVLTVTNSTISDNTASDRGGGIGNQEGTVTLTDSSVNGNTAKDNGGISNESGALTVINSTISGNTATAS